jgi:hypothetical protein
MRWFVVKMRGQTRRKVVASGGGKLLISTQATRLNKSLSKREVERLSM